MKDYAIQEMANINDPDLIRNCVSAQTMRCTLSALLRHVISLLAVTPSTAPIRVALSIMDRLVEGALSIELLCQKNRVRDAAILLLSLHELRLDLQYIARNPRRANMWLDHTEEHRKPWRVAEQMVEIYTTQNELDAERWIYRQYSMVKHCNPVGQTFALPIAGDRSALHLDCSKDNSCMVRTHMLALGAHIRCAVTAATEILAEESVDVGDYSDRIEEQWKLLSKYNEEYIYSTLNSRLQNSDRFGAAQEHPS